MGQFAYLLVAAAARVAAFPQAMNTFFSLLAGRSVDPHFGQNCKTRSPLIALGDEFICWLGNACFSRKIAIWRRGGLCAMVQEVFQLSRLWRVFPEGS